MAATSQRIKQLEERNVASEINCMVWSNRMDLVAFSNAKGEVALHRLSWTRAWVLSPHKENCTVDGIAWRPDGKILAIAYNDGHISLINIETKAVLNKFRVPGKVSFISWIQEKPEVKPKHIYKMHMQRDEDKEQQRFIDLSKPYIRDPPPVSHLEGTVNFEDIKGLLSFLQEQPEFNLLVVGTQQGIIQVRVFGCWNCLILNLSEKIGYKCSIQNIHFTEDLSKLFVTITDEAYNVRTILFNSNIFKDHSAELYHIAMKYIKLHELVLYISKVLTSITETWENILLEIDQKLAKYANQVPEGGVTADFLELLMFGVCSERMEEFLIHDLTKKGLEKFGQTMEVSYANIQSYLFRHVIKFSQNGTFHLSELNGMALFEERFGVIGLDGTQLQKAIRSNGAFVIKAGEMQQIINHSVINYKAFFRWLYASIMNLMDEAIPSDIQKMTQQDLACITEFLQNFDNYGQNAEKDQHHKFIMERIGQYLVDDNLTIEPDMSGNDFTQFISENECLKSNPNILTHYAKKSLVQVFKELQNNIEGVFESPLKTIGKAVTPMSYLNSFNLGLAKIIVSSVNVSSDLLLLAFVNPQKSINLIQITFDDKGECRSRWGNFFFYQEKSQDSEEFDEPFNVIDTEFYSANILSVLLLENSYLKRGGIFQLNMTSALDQLVDVDLSADPLRVNGPSINAYVFAQKIFKNVEMPVSEFAVSGARRVSIVLGENRRKVKLFEMECEEDEEEEDMSGFVKEESIQLNS